MSEKLPTMLELEKIAETIAAVKRLISWADTDDVYYLIDGRRTPEQIVDKLVLQNSGPVTVADILPGFITPPEKE